MRDSVDWRQECFSAIDLGLWQIGAVSAPAAMAAFIRAQNASLCVRFPLRDGFRAKRAEMGDDVSLRFHFSHLPQSRGQQPDPSGVSGLRSLFDQRCSEGSHIR